MNITSFVKQTVIKVKNDTNGSETIADLRRQARIENAKSRAKALLDPSYKPVFVQVALFGRLGKNNPHSPIYRQRNAGWRNGYQRINIRHAAEIAVYINPMSKGQYGYHQTSIFKFVK